MLNRRFTPYLIALGIIAFFFVSYLGYRVYQKHVEFEEFISRAMTFQRSVDKDTPLGVDSINSQTLQGAGSTASLTSGLTTNQTGQSNTHRENASKKPVKVKMLSPEEVARYSDGDPHNALRIINENSPPPDVPERAWNEDELVPQFVELPDGKIVKVRLVPGLEILEGDRVSP